MSTKFSTRTEYDFPHLEELQRVSAKSFAKKMSIGLRIFVLAMGCINLGTGLFAVLNYPDHPFMALGMCVLGALFLAWGVFFFSIRAWTVGKAMGHLVNDFRLEEDKLRVSVDKQEGSYGYDSFSMLMEADLCFYLITAEGQGLMLDKDNLKGGTPDQLRAFLEEKCALSCRWVGKKRAK